MEPLVAILKDKIKDKIVRQAAESALEEIQQANQRLLTHYPQLFFCRPCGLRVTSLEARLGFFKEAHFVICRGCNSSLGLLPGVRQVKGLVGCYSEALCQEGETVLIRLWSETDKTTHNADIDCLIIQAGKVENYDLAVNAVINVLKSDASRPANWCRQIPVILQGNLPLSQGTWNMLKDTFKEVRAE